jgi:hypothetical protein
MGGAVPLRGDYLVTTSHGLFRLRGNEVTMVTPLPAFGAALLNGKLFLSSWSEHDAFILRSQQSIRESLEANSRISWEIIFSERIRNAAGRFHQLSGVDNTLWIANTARNALTKIDSRDGRWLGNICPFSCSFGHPIDTDHNHVNAVFSGRGYVVFGAFKAFKSGAFGLIGKGNIDIFTTENMGIHDSLFLNGDFVYSDTFNYWKGCGHGSLIIDGASVDDSYLAEHRDGVVRGIASTGSEIVVGSSFYADQRSARKDGVGSVLIARDRKFVDRVSLPAAQIYDVIRVDGLKCDPPKSALDYEDALTGLKRALGDPVSTLRITDCFVGRSAKKFDQSDLADVPELL